MDTNWLSKQLDIAYFHFKLGRHQLALDTCVSVLESAPGNPEAQYLSAISRIQLRDYDKGADELLKVMRNFPDRDLYKEYYENLRLANRVSDSVDFFQTLATQNKDDYLIHYFLGQVLLDTNDLDGAAASFSQALELNPEHALSWSGLAGSKRLAHRFHEALDLWHKALELDPNSFVYLNNIALALKSVGRVDEAEPFFCRALALSPSNNGIHSNRLISLLCSATASPEYVFQAHLEWERECAHEFSQNICPHENEIADDRTLKVGYVSADFSCHPVAFFIQPVLLRHDRTRFEIHIYSKVEDPDYITDQFRELGYAWHDISKEDDEFVATMIRGDRIDILIDLGGHTKNDSLLVFARKPAPVQLTWLGYANTTGLSTIDYRITDFVADPPGTTEHLHTEALFRLPRSFITYCAPQNPPSVGTLAATRNGYITFGAFNNFSKTNELIFSIWAKILKRVPGSRLLMKLAGSNSKQLQDSIFESFERFGISRERVELVDMLPNILEHLDLFNSVDIALDTYPYNGTTTTCEALFMGVPVVSLAGRVHVSRVGTSLLEQAGLPELVATTETDYIEKAVNLASDVDKILHYRTSLREILQKSPLMDAEGFTLTLESAYRKMWQIWCQKQRENMLLSLEEK